MPGNNFDPAQFLNQQLGFLTKSIKSLRLSNSDSDCLRECELIAKFSCELFTSLHEWDLQQALQLLEGDDQPSCIDPLRSMYSSWLTQSEILSEVIHQQLSQTRDYSPRYLNELPALIEECRWMLTSAGELFKQPSFEKLRKDVIEDSSLISKAYSSSNGSRLSLTAEVEKAVTTFPTCFHWRNLAEATIQSFCKDFNATHWRLQKIASDSQSQILTMNITHRHRVLMFKQKQAIIWFWLGDFGNYRELVEAETT